VAGLLLALWRPLAGAFRGGDPAKPDATTTRVSVTPATREDLCKEVRIPAEFRPYQEVALHAKVSGYVKDMKVDIGDKVKKDDLLAVLEVPELEDELHRTQAALQRAEADYTDAHLIHTRLTAVNKEHPNLVAQQDLDTAEARDHTTKAAIGAAKAEMEKEQTLLSYTRITAPFDGVITWRYVDNGALIQAGTASDTQSLPVVQVSDNYHLRLDFPVSVDDVKDIHEGDKVEVRVQSLGGKTFTGNIARLTRKVSMDTRTMITEIEVHNPQLELVPGMYAVVTLRLQPRPHALAIPTEAIFGERTGEKGKVYVVNGQHEVEPRSVTLGLETPFRYEVLGGLHEGELVMVGGWGRVGPGQKVAPVPVAPHPEDSSP
jgi:RND family efflux transporter MFP subunit